MDFKKSDGTIFAKRNNLQEEIWVWVAFAKVDRQELIELRDDLLSKTSINNRGIFNSLAIRDW